MQKKSSRLRSIDVFRAITMLFMIFVNDVSSVTGIPAWIDHVKADEDGLGFADTVFPAFLFIVGLSLPIAIGSRYDKGHSHLQVAGYILTRSLALIVMGFFHVNLENYNPAASFPLPAWQIGITVSFFLIWLNYSSKVSTKLKYLLIGVGVLLLAFLAIIFKGGTEAAPEPMRPHWWGILGIIGWAYLVSALIYLLLQDRRWFVPAAFALLLAINIGSHTGLLTMQIPVLGDASSATIVMSGICISVWYQHLVDKHKRGNFLPLALLAGVVMIVAGLSIRPLAEGISKIHSTPAWVLICSGISTVIFALLSWLIDTHAKQDWFKLVKPAGTSTLTCYLLPYLLYALYQIVGFNYPAFFNVGDGGILRSLVVAFVIILLTGVLEKKHLTLKI
ncbi:MAG: DUF5009 domain-containing protein [Bacteroidota bacterium]